MNDKKMLVSFPLFCHSYVIPILSFLSSFLFLSLFKARITFNNVNGSQSCPPGIVSLRDAAEASNDVDSSSSEESANQNTRCVIDKSLFEIYHNYRDLSTDVPAYRDNSSVIADDDDLLQLAIQQSLLAVSYTHLTLPTICSV